MDGSRLETRDYSPPAWAEERALVLPDACSGLRLDQALARCIPEYSRTQLRSWVDAGLVTVEGRPGVAKQRVDGGERVAVRITALPEGAPDVPEDRPLAVVFEDDHVLVIDKPAGLVVHPGAGNRTGTLLNALLAHAPQVRDLPRAGIVHRLDKDTTGLLVVAKTPAAQTSLVRQLHDRTVSRIYRAIVHGRVASGGIVDAPIGRHPTNRTRMAVIPRGRPARTHYLPLAGGLHWTHLECRLESGRTHQIRVHMDHIGHPLLGDPVYGNRHPNRPLAMALAGFGRQALHACALQFEHPVTGQPWRGESPLPADLGALLHRLEATAC